MQHTEPNHRAFDMVGISVFTSSATGASTRELMHRMGHSSAAAALRYQHATRDRDAVIAQALSDVIEAGRGNLSSEIDE